jgi:hypothetical protein
MPASEGKRTSHGNDAIWKQVTDIAKIQEGQSARLLALESKVDSGFMELRNAIDGLTGSLRTLTKPKDPRETWQLFLSAIAVVIVIVGAIMAPLYSAIGDNQVYIRGAIDARMNYREQQGRQDEALRSLQDDDDELREAVIALQEKALEHEGRHGRMEGRHEMLVERVNAIDEGGSRYWNSRERRAE